jgi:ABC-2 type transport system ATP-binding protein
MISDCPISVRGLEKTFGGRFRRRFRALAGIDLDVRAGTVFGLLGPNGAGKTTLIKILLGLTPSYSGEARLFGAAPGDPRARERVGFLPEAHRLPGYLTGRQALFLLGELSGRPRAWLAERVPGWLERVGMTAHADRKVREYSKGMQQRIGLAQALIHEPELVFLDEPTDGVDPVGRVAIREIVADLKRRGVTVFVNSHLLAELERMCDRVVILDRGRVVREGTITELTPRTGRVAFEVDPLPADLERMLTGLGANLVRIPGGFELDVTREEQDATLDRLRGAGVHVASVVPRKLSLEEAFLDLVGDRP